MDLKFDSSVEEKNLDMIQRDIKWFIDLNWLKQNQRSLPVLAQSCLCPQCKDLITKKPDIASTKLLSKIRSCCCKSQDFINRRLPILESVFRLFLANGNQPLNLEELMKQLSEWWGGDTYRISAENLHRLLSSDQYYGLRQVPQNIEAKNS